MVQGFIEKKTVPNEKIECAIHEKLYSIKDEKVGLTNLPASVMNATLQWKGGDEQEHVHCLKEMNKDQWRKWEKSLSQAGVALESYQLESIHEPVKKIDPQKARAVEQAAKDYLKVYFPDEIGATRCETKNRMLKTAIRIHTLPYIPKFFRKAILRGYILINIRKISKLG